MGRKIYLKKVPELDDVFPCHGCYFEREHRKGRLRCVLLRKEKKLPPCASAGIIFKLVKIEEK